ncbi:MAG: hypothetical protein ABH846_02900 [Patescibacteria group bacterium]
MENFIFGILALAKLMVIELSVLFNSEVIRGFLVGYVVATLIYGFIESNQRHQERMHNLKKK